MSIVHEQRAARIVDRNAWLNPADRVKNLPGGYVHAGEAVFGSSQAVCAIRETEKSK